MGISDVADFKAYRQSLFIGNDGRVFILGSNENSGLGDGDSSGSAEVPYYHPLGGSYALVAGEGDTDYASFTIEGYTLVTNASLPGGSYSVRVKATPDSGVAVEEVLSIRVGAIIDFLQVNEGQPAGTAVAQFLTSSPEMKQVSAGVRTSFFLTVDGALMAAGDNSSYELGDGTNVNRLTPQEVFPSDIEKVVAAHDWSLFLKQDSSLWVVGNNEYGRLGTGDLNSRTTPVMIVSSGVVDIAAFHRHSLFIKDDGTLWGMGSSQSGRLGSLGTIDNIPTPQQFMTGVVKIAAGRGHTLIIKDNGSLWATGYNEFG